MNSLLLATVTVQDDGHSILCVRAKNEDEARRVLGTLTTIIISDDKDQILFAEKLRVVVQPQINLELADLAPATDGLVCSDRSPEKP